MNKTLFLNNGWPIDFPLLITAPLGQCRLPNEAFRNWGDSLVFVWDGNGVCPNERKSDFGFS